MVAHGTPCLGPITQAGCGAICPAFGRGCYGCFGPVAVPNLAALIAQLRRLGMTEDAVDRVLATFNAASPALASGTGLDPLCRAARTAPRRAAGTAAGRRGGRGGVVAAGRSHVSGQADILVAGAGPAELALALQAHDHGAVVRVVERRPEAFRPSRALILHSRTLEVLRPLGARRRCWPGPTSRPRRTCG